MSVLSSVTRLSDRIFLRVCEAIAPYQLEWRSHPKSRSAKELLGHLIGHEQDLKKLADGDVINHRAQVPFTSVTQATELYREAQQALEGKLKVLDD